MIATETKQKVCDLLNKEFNQYFGCLMNDADMFDLVKRHRLMIAEQLNVPVENVEWNHKGEEYRVKTDDETVRFVITAKRQEC